MTNNNSTDSIINAKKLSINYKNKIIWNDATFEVKNGEFIVILGPNGTGKTTLFKLLLGLLRPQKGELKVFGDKPQRGNSRIGYVPQRHLVDTDININVSEYIRLGLKGQSWGFSAPWQTGRERLQVKEVLKLVDGESLAGRSIGKLSGGELQRVFLAQALVSKPDLLLLDEPLANMDIRRQSELIKVISHITSSQHVTVLLIAHDINPLLPFVDKIIYIVNHRIATGKVSDIITSQSLSELYDAPVEVLHDSRGRLVVVGTEEVAHHE